MNPITGTPSGVDWMLAAAQILGTIAWPTAAVIILLAFRKPLQELLQHVAGLSFGGAKVTFDRTSPGVTESVVEALEDAASESPQATPMPLREYYAERAETNPLNAILEAYIAIERWYDAALTKHNADNYDGLKKLGVSQMSRIAVSKGLVPASTLPAVDGLTALRNLVVHAPGKKLGPEEAREYLVLADGLLYSLRAGLEKYEMRHPAPAA